MAWLREQTGVFEHDAFIRKPFFRYIDIYIVRYIV